MAVGFLVSGFDGNPGGRVNLQIFGTRKCSETRRAEMFFKERRVAYQWVDLAEKGMSPGELRAVSASVPLDSLIDTEGRQYERRHLKFVRHDAQAELLADPLLFRTPIVRDGNRATVGYCPDTWKAWLNPPGLRARPPHCRPPET